MVKASQGYSRSEACWESCQDAAALNASTCSPRWENRSRLPSARLPVDIYVTIILRNWNTVAFNAFKARGEHVKDLAAAPQTPPSCC